MHTCQAHVSIKKKEMHNYVIQSNKIEQDCRILVRKTVEFK